MTAKSKVVFRDTFSLGWESVSSNCFSNILH
jgi:hypothetical protein